MTELLTIPDVDYDRAVHTLPVALATMQVGQPVIVRLYETSAGKMAVCEPADPFTPPDRVNGVVAEGVSAGHAARIWAGQRGSGRLIIAGVLPAGANDGTE